MAQGLIRDESGAAVAEYALIAALLGIILIFASAGLGTAVSATMDWRHTTGPNGVVHTCTANCNFDYQDYCLAINDTANHIANPPPTFAPALPADDPSCHH